ncbi:MAG TPA: hypothetical protein ENI20_02405 [Bacteroides sp.]|nr:hypothetical protein [Bacteroides sp.]
MNRLFRIRQTIRKISSFEFWPFWLFYLPMYFYGLFLAIRSCSFTYFTATNPGMKYGGAFGTSKYDVLQRIKAELVPQGILIRNEDRLNPIQPEYLKQVLDDRGLKFPIIAKPDVGERGKGVELTENMQDLEVYLSEHHGLIILQEYISLPMELGIFYYCSPDKSVKEITSVVIRDFLRVEGDGLKTMRELINGNMRAQTRRNYFYRKFRDNLDVIPQKGSSVLLEPIGNHVRGTCFLNGNYLINEDLLKMISGIAEDIKGFDYGRFDIRVENLDKLYMGEGIKILELNGVNSEPAHIYDPNYKLFHAYRDIAKHMKIIYEISLYNHRKGIPHAALGRFLIDFIVHIFPFKRP